MTQRRYSDPEPWEWAALGAFLAAMAALLLLGGCSPRTLQESRTQYVFRDRETTDIARMAVADLQYVRDSVNTSERRKGDTVYHTEWRERTVWRDREVHDTVYKERTDTLYRDRVQTIPIENTLSASQKAKIGSWWWLAAALAACLAYIFRKPLGAVCKTVAKIL